MFVFAGERPGHAGSDGSASRGIGRPPSDLQAVARIRGRRLSGVAAGLHGCSNGKRSCAADTQWYAVPHDGGRWGAECI